MANYQLLKADIDAKVYENAYREITGEKLNSVLNAMVTILGAEYQFAGVATTATNPGTPDAKVFYIAKGKGTYTNFGGLEVTEDDVVVLYWDTAWHKVSTGIASQAKLSELAGYVDSKVDAIAATKQDVLTAGKGIVIDDNNTISINFDPDIFKVVSTLPETPDTGDEKKIHLVPSDSGESGNAYDEYIYVDGSWEKIGSFRPSIDLSEYAKTADIPVKKGTGDDSIVQKGGNNASGTYSSAFGFSTVSNGNASHTEGISTIALNAYEHAEGRGNVSIKDKTVHTVGIGSLDGRVRKNAEEIHRSGDKYVIGIGGYDGTNSQTEGVKTVQEVVEETNTKIDAKADKSYVDDKYTALDSRTPVDSGISFVRPWEFFPEYSEDVQDVQNYISPGFLQINNQMASVDGLFNHIRDNNLAGKAAYFTIQASLGTTSAAIIGNIDAGAVGYKISFSTISRYSDDTNFNNRLIFFEIEIGNLTGDGITIMNSRLMNIRIKDTLSKIDNNTSKIQALETKNTELTNTITTLELRIAELENIISQITIKEE